MRLTTSKCLLGLLLSALFANAALAEDNQFRRLSLSYGISLDIPSHWSVLTQSQQNNIAAAATAAMGNAGAEESGVHKDRLLAINATPIPSGATVRVNVTYPAEFTQADLANITPEDLKAVEEELREGAQQMGNESPTKIIETQPARVDNINGMLALAVSYVREGFSDGSPWLVTLYQIPIDNRIIQLTLSYRQSDAILWRPIQEHIKRSIQVSNRASSSSTKTPAKTWFSFNPLDHGEADCVKASTDPIHDMRLRFGATNVHMDHYGTIADKTTYMTMSANAGTSHRAYFDSLAGCRNARQVVLTKLAR
jgi:hypothetical protein